jgi:hypothetical protein
VVGSSALTEHTPAPVAFPAAHELAECGWLRLEFADDGNRPWRWSPAAERTFEALRIARAAAASAN